MVTTHWWAILDKRAARFLSTTVFGRAKKHTPALRVNKYAKRLVECFVEGLRKKQVEIL
jgi:hypothetical protein